MNGATYLVAGCSLQPKHDGNAEGGSWVDKILKGEAIGRLESANLKLSMTPPPTFLRSAPENLYAFKAINDLMDVSGLNFKSPDIAARISLHTAVMAQGDFPGTRNWSRTGKLTSQGVTGASPLESVLEQIHPLIPLLNLPNLLASEIAMQFGFSQNQSLFLAESSGVMAILDAQRSLRLGISDLALVVSAHSFGPGLMDLVMNNWEEFSSDETLVPPQENAVALLFSNTAGLDLFPESQSLELSMTTAGLDPVHPLFSYTGTSPWLCSGLPMALMDALHGAESFGDAYSKHLDGQWGRVQWRRNAH